MASLEEALARLQALAKSPKQKHRLGKAATAAEIKAAEKRIGRKLPEELVALYTHCNGFALFLDTDPIGIDGSPFRLIALEALQTWAETAGAEDDAKGWTKPKSATSKAWVADPLRVGVFDLANGDLLSFTEPEQGKPIWIDDYHEGPSLLGVQSVADILEQALDPSCVEVGAWTSPFMGEHADEDESVDYANADVVALYPGSPAHFLAEAALERGQAERALELARNGRKGDKEFRTVCDVLVAESLVALGRRDELASEADAITKRWSTKPSRAKSPLVHPAMWERLERAVASQLPELALLPAIRAAREEAARGDFI